MAKCRNLNLMLVTKARVCKIWGPRVKPKNHISCSQKHYEGMNLHIPKLDSQWTPKPLEGDYKGQNSLD